MRAKCIDKSWLNMARMFYQMLYFASSHVKFFSAKSVRASGDGRKVNTVKITSTLCQKTLACVLAPV